MEQMNFLKLAKERRTVYDFRIKKVDKRIINKILESGRWAPSSHNSQPWSFIVIKDKDTIERMMNLCYYGYFHSLPPIMIVIVLEPIYLCDEALLRGRAKEFVDSHKYMNIGFVASNMIHTAESLGVNSCIISFLVEKANKILEVPKGKEAVIAIGLGYERKSRFIRSRMRKDLNKIVFVEKYKGKSNANENKQ